MLLSATPHRHIAVSARSLAEKEGEIRHTKVLSAGLFFEEDKGKEIGLGEVEGPGTNDRLRAALHP